MKGRCLGAGPRDKIDVEFEEFIAKAIESKATYHDRHKETVMFTNRRVKVHDLLNIANFHPENQGKIPIRSAITIIIIIMIVYSTFLQHRLNYKAGH